ERHYRRVFEQTNDAALIADLGGRLLGANPKAAELLGYSGVAELMAARPDGLDLVDPIEGRRIRDQLRQRGWVEFETAVRNRHGDAVMLKGSIRLTHNDVGANDGYLAVAGDVTRTRQLEEQLRQAQSMEAVGRLAGGIVHDFSNILTAIQGYCDLLRQEVQDSVARTYAGEIAAAAGRAADLSSKLLALGRQQGQERHVVPINGRVRELEGLLQRAIGEDIELDVDLAAEAGFVRVDVGELDQALLNLAINARDAMPSGGRLTLRTRPVDLDVSTLGSLDLDSGPYVEMLVEDTGVGMDEHTLERIFEPFFTTKDVGQGTGLGLAMVFATVRRHGGHVEARSKPGRGTVMAVYLPRLEAPAGVSAQGAGESSSGGSETLLLVEDDPVVRRLLEQQLHRQGFRVLVADSGPMAIEMAERHGTPDLLVSDVV
ncbi:MAG: ATP-binding protein, partial [Acidobacteriota bacterium]